MSTLSETTHSETLLIRLQTLENQLAESQTNWQQTRAELERTRQQMQTATRQTRIVASTTFAVLLGGMLLLSRPAAMAQAGVTLSSLLTRVVALETKTAALTQTGIPGTSSAKLTITGDNVQIVDGSGSTNSTSGLGNLTIGYNQTGNDSSSVRTGSHNLILGDDNSYSAFGGFVAGYGNSVSSQYASVSGGAFNRASGHYSSVSGGYSNTASSVNSLVSGGIDNTASGTYSSVSGGRSNTADDYYASVSGGGYNTADAAYSSVSGGYNVTQSNFNGWSGGSYSSP